MTNLKKSSFSIIELVFAMVIMGIVMTSIPMLLQTSSDNLETSNNEEYLFDSLELMNEINTKYFDEENTKHNNEKKVLTSNNGDSELKCNREGIVELNNSGAECSSDDVTSASQLGQDNGNNDYNDIDDYNGYSDNIAKVDVIYIKDNSKYNDNTINFTLDTTNKGSDSNIKFVSMNIKNNGKTVAVLKYFASNIGQATIENKK